jgi:hypothetical protein
MKLCNFNKKYEEAKAYMTVHYPISEDPILAGLYSKRNELPADKVGCTSSKEVLWLCSDCGYRWRQCPKEMSVKSLNNGPCPRCSKKKKKIAKKRKVKS